VAGFYLIEVRDCVLKDDECNWVLSIVLILISHIKNLKIRYRMELVNFILEKIEEKPSDSSTIENYIRNK